MKKYAGFIKGFLLFLFVVFLYGFSSIRNNHKKATEININFENGDNLFITYEMVNKLLIQNYTGLQNQPKENLILNKLESTLLANDMIENAEVFLSVDGELGVIVKQKTPVARVNHKEQAYYIDIKGDRMPLSSNYSARVPLIEGVYGGEISKEMYQLVMLVHEDDFLRQQIVGVEETSEKEFVLKTRVGNQTVELGNLTRLDKKIKKLKVFYQKIIKDKTLDSYKKINLAYTNQVVCTKK